MANYIVPSTSTTTRRYYKYKYWKYQEENWTQPVFTSMVADDGSYIVASGHGNNQQPWKAMDGIIPNKNNGDAEWASTDTLAGYWMVRFPYKIRVTGLVHYNMYSDTAKNKPIVGRFWADTQKTIPIGDQISTSTSSAAATTIANIPANGVITDTIYFEKISSKVYGGIGELVITAKKISSTVVESNSSDYDYRTIVEGSASSYDFYSDVTPRNDKCFTTKAKNYCKQLYWRHNKDGSNNGSEEGGTVAGIVLPLTSNTSCGVITSKDTSDTGSGYEFLDGNASTDWWDTKSDTSWWQWQLPVPIRITGIRIVSTCMTNSARFYTSSAKTTPIGDNIVITTTDSTSTTITGIPSSGIVTDCIYFEATKHPSDWRISYRELYLTYTVVNDTPTVPEDPEVTYPSDTYPIIPATKSNYNFTSIVKRPAFMGDATVHTYWKPVCNVTHPLYTINGYCSITYTGNEWANTERLIKSSLSSLECSCAGTSTYVEIDLGEVVQLGHISALCRTNNLSTAGNIRVEYLAGGGVFKPLGTSQNSFIEVDGSDISTYHKFYRLTVYGPVITRKLRIYGYTGDNGNTPSSSNKLQIIQGGLSFYDVKTVTSMVEALPTIGDYYFETDTVIGPSSYEYTEDVTTKYTAQH